MADSSISPEVKKDSGHAADFRGRISRKLSLIFGLLFFIVLLVGGVSLYLTSSIYFGTEKIREEREQIDLTDQIHSTIHHFVSDLQRSLLRGETPSGETRTSYLQKLSELLERQRGESETERKLSAELHQVVAQLISLSGKIRSETRRHEITSPPSLRGLEKIEARVQVIVHQLSMLNRAKMDQTIAESRWKRQLILGLYAAFVVVGGFLILASNLFFSRTFAKPLQRLARSASKIASGDLEEQVPVTSKDEIGQLSHAFNFMVGRLKEHEERLKVVATMEERERVAQELHDSLAQDLAVLHLNLIEAEENLPQDGGAGLKEILAEVRKTADRAFEDVRQAIFGLHTMVSKGLGFIPTLTEYLHDFSEMRKIPVDLKFDSPETARFSPGVEVQLIRIIHEALTNIYKHAQATRSIVKFERGGDFARVTIEDNGKGFVAEEVAGKRLHFGLQTMRKRAEGVGGKLTIESAPGKGTKVTVFLPYEKGSHETHSLTAGR